MPLTVLGTNIIAVEDEWVQFNPITLPSNRTYLLELEVLSANPEFIYSRFEYRYLYPTQNSAQSSSLNGGSFYFEPVRQNAELRLSSLLAPSGDLTLFVRRFPFYSNPSNLAEASVRLALDPAIFV